MCMCKVSYVIHACRMLFMVVPVYISELAPKSQRGRLVCFNILGLTGGLLVSVFTMHTS